MANTKNTTAPTAPTAPVGDTPKSREHIELPDLKVSKSDVQLSDVITRTRINPLVAAVANANKNRGDTFKVEGITNEKQADKVIRLLSAAGREQEVVRNAKDEIVSGPCSVRVKYDADKQIVLFKCVDLVTRTRKS